MKLRTKILGILFVILCLLGCITLGLLASSEKFFLVQTIDGEDEESIAIYKWKAGPLEEVMFDQYCFQILSSESSITPKTYFYSSSFGKVPAFDCYRSDDLTICGLYEESSPSAILALYDNQSGEVFPSRMSNVDVVEINVDEYLGRIKTVLNKLSEDISASLSFEDIVVTGLNVETSVRVLPPPSSGNESVTN
jgi:hypothetical protein